MKVDAVYSSEILAHGQVLPRATTQETTIYTHISVKTSNLTFTISVRFNM
jgi:hypothetical protein